MWKLYFWIYGILTIIGLLVMIPMISSLNFVSYLGIVEGILLILATYEFIYKKVLLAPNIWRVIFFILIAWWTLQILVALLNITSLNFLLTNVSGSTDGLRVGIFSIIFSIPAMIAMYRISKGKFLTK